MNSSVQHHHWWPFLLSVRTFHRHSFFSTMRLTVLVVCFFCLFGLVRLDPLPIRHKNRTVGEVANRIIDGTPAVKGEFPFMVLLLTEQRACSGTLIAPSYVLTAANCFKSHHVTNPTLVTARINTVESADVSSVDVFIRRARAVIPHQYYGFAGYPVLLFDIALVVLESPVIGIKPVTLPWQAPPTPALERLLPISWNNPLTLDTNEKNNEFRLAWIDPKKELLGLPNFEYYLMDSETLVEVADEQTPVKVPTLPPTEPVNEQVKAIVGWGIATPLSSTSLEESHYPSQRLQKAGVYIVPNTKCAETLDELFISDTTLCTMYPLRTACYGDEGGPLLLGNIQLGIISVFNEECIPGQANAHTKVAYFQGWIESTIANNPAPLPAIAP